MRKPTLIILGLLALFTACMGVAAKRNANDAARKKARYYYTAGAVEKARGNDDAAHEYFRRAYDTDPSYEEAASAYAMGRLSLLTDTFQSDVELDRSLNMLRAFVDKYPEELFEAQYYSYVANEMGNYDEAIRVLERTADAKPSATMTLLMLSNVYAQSGQLDKAVETLGRYEQDEGLKPQITTQKISYLIASSDTLAALAEAQRLVASDTTNADYLILKGNVFSVLEMPDSALRYYNLAERIAPEAGSAKMALADYYRDMGDSVNYDQKLYEMLLCEDIDLDSKADALAQYLQVLINDKQNTESGDYLFTVLRDQYPHEPRLLDLAARYSAAKQDFKAAVEQMAYAIDLDPTNMDYWALLMTYQAINKDYDNAFATYERAKEHGTPDVSMQMQYASVASAAERFDLASDVYRDLIHEIVPDLQTDSVLSLSDLPRDISLQQLDMLSQLIATLGDLYHGAGDNPMAYRMYDNALTFNPSNAMAANNYAYFLALDNGDLDKALELSSSSLSGENANNPTFLDTFAWLNYLKGDAATAETWQQKAIDNLGESEYAAAELFHHMGDIKAKLGKYEEALESFEKAARLMEENEETEGKEYPELLEKIKELKDNKVGQLPAEPTTDINTDTNTDN